MEPANPYAAPRADVRDIETPAMGQVTAGRARRLGAALLDGVAALLLIFLPAGVVGGFNAAASGLGSGVTAINEMSGGMALAIFVGAAVLIAITWYLVHTNGQTIGKKMLGIKVVRSDGSRASVAHIFWIRNAPFAVVGNIPFLGIGTMSFLIDNLLIFRASNQCLHDQLADTIVIEA
jgi:uncharacterized RDD family membrane protein YckC